MSSSDPTRRPRRKLLIASIGVATVSYTLLTACEKAPSGNLMAPQPPPSATPVVGNPGEPTADAGSADAGKK
jgi:hypothetical protein